MAMTTKSGVNNINSNKVNDANNNKSSFIKTNCFWTVEVSL